MNQYLIICGPSCLMAFLGVTYIRIRYVASSDDRHIPHHLLQGGSLGIIVSSTIVSSQLVLIVVEADGSSEMRLKRLELVLIWVINNSAVFMY